MSIYQRMKGKADGPSCRDGVWGLPFYIVKLLAMGELLNDFH